MRQARIVLGITVLSLLAIGLTVLASAGEVSGTRLHGSPYYFLIRQGIWLAGGLAAFAVAAFFDYRKWLERPLLLIAAYLAIFVMMCVVLKFRTINGSHRWIILGPLRIQPCEFAKIMTVIAVSVMLVKADWKTGLFWRGLSPIIGIVGVFLVLALKEPDFGSTLVMFATMATLLFVGGMRWLHFITAGALGALAFLGYLSTNDNRMRRVVAWLPEQVMPFVQKCCPWVDFDVSGKDVEEANHQLNQALVAIRRPFDQGGIVGAWTGVGFNNSMQKQLYLPENHTDFIFAIGAEEWGLAFSLLTVVLFTILFATGLYIAWKARDRLGRLIAFGISFLLFFQALFNIGVVTGLLPTKGLALPFMSYGGTNLLSALLATGMLWGITRHADRSTHGTAATVDAPVFYR